jgi:hypothetical protein
LLEAADRAPHAEPLRRKIHHCRELRTRHDARRLKGQRIAPYVLRAARATTEDDARRHSGNPTENRGEEDQKDERNAAVAEDPADPHTTRVLDDEDHEQDQRRRCPQIERALATVAPGARLTGFWNLGHRVASARTIVEQCEFILKSRGRQMPRRPCGRRVETAPDTQFRGML